MQLTLVSHYGSKPPELARLISTLQEHLRGDAISRLLAQNYGDVLGFKSNIPWMESMTVFKESSDEVSNAFAVDRLSLAAFCTTLEHRKPGGGAPLEE